MRIRPALAIITLSFIVACPKSYAHIAIDTDYSKDSPFANAQETAEHECIALLQEKVAVDLSGFSRSYAVQHFKSLSHQVGEDKAKLAITIGKDAAAKILRNPDYEKSTTKLIFSNNLCTAYTLDDPSLSTFRK
jgi:hypothetical protein